MAEYLLVMISQNVTKLLNVWCRRGGYLMVWHTRFKLLHSAHFVPLKVIPRGPKPGKI